MVAKLGYENRKLAEARLARLNSYLRRHFDGHELTVLRESPKMLQSTKRLRELFRAAIEKVDRSKRASSKKAAPSK